jgi:hypothetical protein
VAWKPVQLGASATFLFFTLRCFGVIPPLEFHRGDPEGNARAERVLFWLGVVLIGIGVYGLGSNVYAVYLLARRGTRRRWQTGLTIALSVVTTAGTIWVGLYVLTEVVGK